MSILVNENLLRLHYLKETGKERPLYTPVSDYGEYIEWLEEKVTKLLVTQEQFADIGTALRKREEEIKYSEKDMEAFAEWTAFMRWIYDPTDNGWFQKHSSETKITTKLREMWEKERKEEAE